MRKRVTGQKERVLVCLVEHGVRDGLLYAYAGDVEDGVVETLVHGWTRGIGETVVNKPEIQHTETVQN